MAVHVTRCVICNSTEAREILVADRVAAHPFRPPSAAGKAAGFGRLAIVRCRACAHLYNAAFDPAGADELYGAFVLTNMPVSSAMMKAVEATAESILRHAEPRPSVLEVGGGGGALALVLAEQASEVHLVEPSRALSADRFAGTNVAFHQAMFPVQALADRRFDVVVCRQVLEHVPEPAPFLAALRRQIADSGIAYIEIPSAEYIENHASIVDFHYPHVHYYRRSAAETLFARAGFRVDHVVDVKDGHDVAFILRPVPGGREAAITIERRATDHLNDVLARQRARGAARLAGIDGPIALYGANAYSQALLGLYPEIAEFARVFDDTPLYSGQLAYGPRHDIPIELPHSERISEMAAIIVTAYLHDRTIGQKLRAFGFRGPIYSVRSDKRAGVGDTPASLFG